MLGAKCLGARWQTPRNRHLVIAGCRTLVLMGLVERPWVKQLEVKTTRFDLMCAPVRVSWVRGPDC